MSENTQLLRDKKPSVEKISDYIADNAEVRNVLSKKLSIAKTVMVEMLNVKKQGVTASQKQ